MYVLLEPFGIRSLSVIYDSSPTRGYSFYQARRSESLRTLQSTAVAQSTTKEISHISGINSSDTLLALWCKLIMCIYMVLYRLHILVPLNTNSTHYISRMYQTLYFAPMPAPSKLQPELTRIT